MRPASRCPMGAGRRARATWRHLPWPASWRGSSAMLLLVGMSMRWSSCSQAARSSQAARLRADGQAKVWATMSAPRLRRERAYELEADEIDLEWRLLLDIAASNRRPASRRRVRAPLQAGPDADGPRDLLCAGDGAGALPSGAVFLRSARPFRRRHQSSVEAIGAALRQAGAPASSALNGEGVSARCRSLKPRRAGLSDSGAAIESRAKVLDEECAARSIRCAVDPHGALSRRRAATGALRQRSGIAGASFTVIEIGKALVVMRRGDR